MSNETPARTAVVFSCDEAYVFLARGLVLSLADAGYPDSSTTLILVDIGCSAEALSWMQAHGVEIVQFDPTLIPRKVMDVIKPAQRAQVLRPWLPELLPQFEHFVWLDCDLWLQNGELIPIMRAGANAAPDAVTLAPGNSHYNNAFYTNIERIVNMQRNWYRAGYEPDFAAEAALGIHYSSGVFGMRRASPVWELWRLEVETLYPVIAVKDASLLHLAEQIALNAVIFRTKLFLRLDPLYNFHCNGGGALRTAEGSVMSNLLLPAREVSVIHLANWSILRDHYVKLRLLYRGGDYLSHAEWALLERR